MQIQLNVLVVTTVNDQVFAVSLDQKDLVMPNLDMSSIKGSTQLTFYLEKLYSKYVELDINWNYPILLDNCISQNDKEQNVFNVTYGCTVPNVQLVVKKSHLINVTELVEKSNILKKILCISL